MRDELEAPSPDRHFSLHNNDAHISVDELWESWQQSEGTTYYLLLSPYYLLLSP